ncbi:hypothetical protein [Mycolicibacterium wolinskyi]|uniref:hypothetical protein n=1 Tax=Mycolicibacterium wolinskyi TaxID=59750 RepID=UPI001F1EAF51|nr:hypothetical protein [Mycolicibacterium wolinskyi]
MRPHAVVGTFLLLAMVVACVGHAPSEPKVDRWSGVAAEVRFRWTASNEIDLLSGPAVPVRAYTESYSLANIMGDVKYVYPGFDDAVAQDDRDGSGPRPDNRSPAQHPLVGNFLNHILRIDQSGTDRTVLICHWYFAVGSNTGGGKVVPYADMAWPVLTRVHMTAPETESSESVPPQEGPSAAPAGDVFGGWRIVSRDYASDALPPGTNWPSFRADEQACVAIAPAPLDRREFLTRGEHTLADFPTLRAEPGWPHA